MSADSDNSSPEVPESDRQQLIDRFQAIIRARKILWSTERPFLRKLGFGGQGSVYLSVRRGADSFSVPVALKLFSPAAFETPQEYGEEMLRVGRVAARVARIQHDNVIYVHDVIEQQQVHMMEMEWLDGYDLFRLLRPDALKYMKSQMSKRRWDSLNREVVTAGAQQARLKPAVAVGVVRECLSGLAALHRAGIVHSDVKPSNIMLKRTGHVKLIDIGSAYELHQIPQRIPCTPAYAAPEVLHGELGTPLSDLASLGYVLIELISGTQPFAGLKYHDLVEAKHSLVDRLNSILPTEEFAYSDLLLPLIRRLVDPDPSRRFESAEAAELSETGASGFLRELVKGDFSGEYVSDIRSWIDSLESEIVLASDLDEELPFGSSLQTTEIFPSSHSSNTPLSQQSPPDKNKGT